MTPDFGEADLDGEVVLDRFLGEHDLDVLQQQLAELAPRWSSKLRLWRGPRDQRPIDVGRPGALGEAVLAAAAERGATYHRLAERHGRPPLERLSGSAELRGAGPELVVVVSVDQLVLSPVGAAKQLGNAVALQVRRPTVERRPGRDWLDSAFTALSGALGPAWGYAAHAGEYWAKVMSEPPRIQAIGRDFGRHLPGLFWLNFFGRRYRELIGEQRLASAPAARLAAVDGGMLISLGPDPLAWDTAEYAIAEQRVRDHLGTQLFFSKAEPERPTIAP